MESLAPEVIFNLLLSLPLSDILSLCSTNKEVFSFCQDDYLWRELVKRDYPYAYSRVKDKTLNWKLLYEELHSFSSSAFYLTLQQRYSYVSDRDVQEWYSLSKDVKITLESSSFYLVQQEPKYEIGRGKVVFYFQVKARERDLTVHDFLEFFSSWKKEVNYLNRLGEEDFLSLGKPGYYIERKLSR